MRLRDWRILRASKASPSASVISRRITRSRVWVLPSISIRSTKTRLPSISSKVMAMVFSSVSFRGLGRTWTKAKPFCAARSVSSLAISSTLVAS